MNRNLLSLGITLLGSGIKDYRCLFEEKGISLILVYSRVRTNLNNGILVLWTVLCLVLHWISNNSQVIHKAKMTYFYISE